MSVERGGTGGSFPLPWGDCSLCWPRILFPTIIETPTISDLHPLGRFPTEAAAHEHALVALALGEACWVLPEPDGDFQLLAEPGPAPRIAAEIEAYVAEQSEPEPPVPDLPTHPVRPMFCLAWVAVLALVFRWQEVDPTLTERAASSSIGLLARGEWWRPFTALFLHGDLGHLVGNIVTGSCFGLLVARSIGALRGWLMILMAGVLGNLATSWIAWPEAFVSLGASTAVFGALGILSGHGVGASFRVRRKVRLAVVAAPLTAGIVLLGFLGGGGNPQTDVLGHCNGFAAGVVLGSLVALADHRAA